MSGLILDGNTVARANGVLTRAIAERELQARENLRVPFPDEDTGLLNEHRLVTVSAAGYTWSFDHQKGPRSVHPLVAPVGDWLLRVDGLAIDWSATIMPHVSPSTLIMEGGCRLYTYIGGAETQDDFELHPSLDLTEKMYCRYAT